MVSAPGEQFYEPELQVWVTLILEPCFEAACERDAMVGVRAVWYLPAQEPLDPPVLQAAQLYSCYAHQGRAEEIVIGRAQSWSKRAGRGA